MRYAVISTRLTISQLQNEVVKYGGRNLRVAVASKQVFCDLDEAGVGKLRTAGHIVTKISGVKADVMPPVIAPPTPVAAAPIYTPEQLIWAAGLEDLRSMTEPPIYGEGINLAIIDTGIRETHQKINGRVVYSKNYTSDPMRDGLDHGTGVCSIALTVMPLCNILNMKVLDDEGIGSEEDVALAIDDCILLYDTNPGIAPSVINLSLGGPDEDNPDNPLRVACRAAIDRGIWVFASCGNGGPLPYSITCPACERYVFAIGSLKYEPFELSNFSSRGPTMRGLIKPDALMFGEDINTASSASDTATIAKSGTSFATPFCSGMAVGYVEGLVRLGGLVEFTGEVPPGIYPEITYLLSPQRLMDEFLLGVCIKPQGAPMGKDNDYGCGLPFGPLVYQALTLRPLFDISTIMAPMMGIMVLGMFGMMIVPMAKAFK